MKKPPIRNRIIDHITVRAGDLVPHPHNFRRHPDRQSQALADSFEEIGFARSLVGYRLPDGRIQLIDGHLRAEIDPNLNVVVEILDVTSEEANKLLLTLDPLAALAKTDEDAARELAQILETDSQALRDLWDMAAANGKPPIIPETEPPVIPEQWLILVTCASEIEQIDLLERLQKEGLPCKALIS
ncbi:MAG: ParB N-terminal domain-containing protein [Gemmataceae bacterium]